MRYMVPSSSASCRGDHFVLGDPDMNVRAPLFIGFLFAGAGLIASACSSKDSASTTSTTTTGTGTTTSATTGTGGAGGAGATCKDVCTTVYNCGLSKDAAM